MEGGESGIFGGMGVRGGSKFFSSFLCRSCRRLHLSNVVVVLLLLLRTISFGHWPD